VKDWNSFDPVSYEIISKMAAVGFPKRGKLMLKCDRCREPANWLRLLAGLSRRKDKRTTYVENSSLVIDLVQFGVAAVQLLIDDHHLLGQSLCKESRHRVRDHPE